MNKKILFAIIIVIFFGGGIIFWQSLNKQDNNLPNPSLEKPKNLVEVFYLPHPPVDPIRQKIKTVLDKFPNYKLKEYSFDDGQSQQKIKDYGLVGHIPVAVFINGENHFSLDGQDIVFQNFPRGDAFVPSLEGSWDYNDLEKILTNPDKYKK